MLRTEYSVAILQALKAGGAQECHKVTTSTKQIQGLRLIFKTSGLRAGEIISKSYENMFNYVQIMPRSTTVFLISGSKLSKRQRILLLTGL